MPPKKNKQLEAEEAERARQAELLAAASTSPDSHSRNTSPPPQTSMDSPPAPSSDIAAMMKFMADEARAARDEARLREEAAREEARKREEAAEARLAQMMAAFQANMTPPSAPTPLPTSPPPPPAPRRALVEPPKKKLAPDASLAVYKAWKRGWDDFTVVNKLDSATQQEQMAYLRQSITSDMENMLTHSLDIPQDTVTPIAEVITKIEDYIKQQDNPALRRLAFTRCKQGDGESFDHFYTRLKQLATDADISCCAPGFKMRIIDGIINGISDEELRTELLSKKADCSVEDHVVYARSFLAARKTSQQLTKPNKIQAISAYKKAKKEASTPRQAKKEPDKNPGGTVYCAHCKIQGHREEKCYKKYPNLFRHKKKPDKKGPHKPACHITSVHEVNEGNDDPLPTIITEVKVGNKLCQVPFITDTGAKVTTIPPTELKKFKLKVKDLKPTCVRLAGANKHEIDSMGTFEAEISHKGRTANTTVHVCKDITNLLSYKTTKALGLLHPKFPDVEPYRVNAIKSSRPLPSSDTSPSDMRTWFMEEFSDVLIPKGSVGRELPIMSGAPMKIELKPDAVPFKLYNARVIPLAWQEPTKKALDDLVAQGIIEPVGDKVSDWVHPMVVVPKPDGRIRITTDLTKLNAHVKRPVHPTDTPEGAIGKIKNGVKFFSTFDCLHGYHQIEVDEGSRHLLQFITPFGRYAYKRCPMGLVSSGDEFCRRVDEAISGIGQLSKVMDDLLAFDESYKEHMQRVYKVLMTCRRNNITLNADKFIFAASEVEWVGYKINEHGRTPTTDRIRALKDFPVPANLTDLRSFMGLVNQLASFSDEIALLAQPLRPLLSTKGSFIWEADQQAAFVKIKEALSKPPILAHFDPKLPTALHTDAAKNFGLGYALLQKHGDRWKLVKCGSRYLSPAESRSYSIIELELTAIVWALHKCRYYLLGLHTFEIVTDHKSLVPILNNYTMDNLETFRLLRLKEKTVNYVFKATWKKGKDHALPDALSRRPVDRPTEDDRTIDESDLYMVGMINASAKLIAAVESDPIMEEIAAAGEQDPMYTQLRTFILNADENSRHNVPEAIRLYTHQLDEMSVEGNVVLKGRRIVVPASLRRKVLGNLHASHMGKDATIRRARQSVWWPGLNSDIKSTVEACEACQIRKASHPKEPLKFDSSPTYPFEEASADLFQVGGKTYLCYADRLSGWAMPFDYGKDTSTKATTGRLLTAFQQVGVPRRLRTDGGPQFSSAEFAEFAKSWGIKHELSSPHNAQSNGHAEAHVKALKNLIAKTNSGRHYWTDAYIKGIIEMRNTPRADGKSPAEILLGRPMRSHVPMHRSLFAPKWNSQIRELELKRAKTKAKVKENYDAKAKNLPKLKIGDEVRVQDPTSKKWSLTGTICEARPNRSYMVKMPSGRLLWRNRRFLYKIPAQTRSSSADEEPLPPPRRATRSSAP